ncbi:MAG: AMP-binding protein [Pseudonocardiaceae bacterium]
MSLVAASTRLVDFATGEILAGAELSERVAAVAAAYSRIPRGLVFVRARLSQCTVLRYLGSCQAGRPIAMLDPALDGPLWTDLIARYEPAVVVGLDHVDEDGANRVPAQYHPQNVPELGPCWIRADVSIHESHPDLAILLSTSGSTGSPKLVRLSKRAVTVNAHAIADVLGIKPDDVAPTCLPLYYSYGLSVLNSHFVRGATVVVANGGFLAREFWSAVDRYEATSLSGVPRSYEILDRLRWTPGHNPTVRVLTQAGGRLRPELIRTFHDKMTAVGGRFHVMWGQTEAAPRMSVLPAERLPDKLGSVGPALPGGQISVRSDDGSETTAPHVVGEVVYRGPNVMFGYAFSAADLAEGDALGGELRTGDLGYLDEDGYLWLTGRVNRIGKVFGLRVNLDDIEDMLRDVGPVAAVAGADRVVVFCENLDEGRGLELTRRLASLLRVHRSGLDVRPVAQLPLLSNGKVDYRSLEAFGDDQAH